MSWSRELSRGSPYRPNADVTNLICEGPNGHPQECAFDAQWSKDGGAQYARLQAVKSAGGTSVQPAKT